MSHHRLGRVVSDLSHSNSRSVTTDRSLHHQSQGRAYRSSMVKNLGPATDQSATTATSNNQGGNAGKATKQKLSVLISSVVSSWTRSESSGEAGGREKNGSSKQQQQATGGWRRRGLEMVLAVRKYVAMVEQLFITSSYSASSGRPDADSRRRDGRPHTFTSARHDGGNAAAAAQAQSSKRHKGRLSSAPASLRGSPATSGHLCYVGESVTKASTSASSEVSTMEELQSAIQAAIAHCKNSVAAAGDKQQQQQQRKC